MSKLRQENRKNLQVQLETSPQQFNPTYYTRFSYRIGLAEFHSAPIVNHKRVTFLNHTIVKKLSSEHLSIADYYYYWRWAELFGSIKKMGQVSVSIYEGYHRSVLREIAGVEWGRLKVLRLSVGNTASVEPIGWLNCEGLEVICLNVKVRTVNKPFVKGYFPRLRSMAIECDGLDEVELGRVAFWDGQQSLSINISANNYSLGRQKQKQPIVDYSFLSKVGWRGHLEVENDDFCGQLHKRERRQYRQVKVLSSMKTKILRSQGLDSSYHTKETKNQTEKVIECLFERKFSVVGDQGEPEMEQFFDAVLQPGIQ